MKIFKFIACLMLASLLFTACKKDLASVYSKPVGERVQDTINAYKAILAAAPNGWMMAIHPNTDSTHGWYNYHVTFNNQGRVTQYPDVDYGASLAESSFKINWLQQPTLIFDTYSSIAKITDPNPAMYNATGNGNGQNSDIEFSMDTVTASKVVLTGTRNGAKAFLTPITNLTSFKADSVMRVQSFFTLYNFNTAVVPKYIFIYMDLNGQTYNCSIDLFARTITIGATDNSFSFTTGWNLSANGIRLIKPFVNQATTLTDLNSLLYSATNNQISFTSNAGNSGLIYGSNKPGNPINPQDAQDFLDPNAFYYTLVPFTVNGVADPFGITKLKDFSSFQFYPWSGNKPFLVYVGNGTWYGPYFSATTTADGRIIYTYTSFYNQAALTTDNYPQIIKLLNQIRIAGGYFVIKTDATHYILISQDYSAFIKFTKA